MFKNDFTVPIFYFVNSTFLCPLDGFSHFLKKKITHHPLFTNPYERYPYVPDSQQLTSTHRHEAGLLHHIDRLDFSCFVLCVIEKTTDWSTESKSKLSLNKHGWLRLTLLSELTQTLSIHFVLYHIFFNAFIVSYSSDTTKALSAHSHCSDIMVHPTSQILTVCHVAALYCPQLETQLMTIFNFRWCAFFHSINHKKRVKKAISNFTQRTKCWSPQIDRLVKLID